MNSDDESQNLRFRIAGDPVARPTHPVDADDIRRARDRRRVLAAVEMGASEWSAVMLVIAESNDATHAAQRLQERFGIDEIQANAVLDMQFRRVGAAERGRLADEIRGIDALIASFESS